MKMDRSQISLDPPNKSVCYEGSKRVYLCFLKGPQKGQPCLGMARAVVLDVGATSDDLAMDGATSDDLATTAAAMVPANNLRALQP